MKKLVLSLFAAALAVLTGCMPQEWMLRCDPELDKSVKVGVIVPLSGSKEVFGVRMLKGLRIAAGELNSGRGINGKPVELIVVDSGSTPEGAARAAESAAAAGAVAMIAGHGTSEVAPLIPMAKSLRIPLVIPLATADDFVGANLFVFRNIYSDSQQAEAIASYLWYWRRTLRIGIAVDMAPENEYSRNIARDVAQHYGDLGGMVVMTGEYTGRDYKETLHRIMMRGPQAIVLPTGAKEAAEMVQYLRKRGYNGIVCGPDSWDSNSFINNLAGDTKPGDCFFIGRFSADTGNSAYEKFAADFKKRYFYMPGSEETLSYDALKMLAIGLGDAKDIKKFTANWLTIKNYFAAAGVCTMLPNGRIDSTIYINNVAAGNVENPFPFKRLNRYFLHSVLETYRNDEPAEDN